jgi:pyruvate ferredoxin oxidoreductase alpha subunit
MINYIYGLGGRDINATEIEAIFESLAKINESGETGEVFRYAGLRE